MPLLAHRQLPPSAKEQAMARASGERLSLFARGKRPLTLRIPESGRRGEKPIELPPGAVAMLMEVLETMAAGRGMTLIPENAELTTVQAAQVLNVSRPFVIKLLEEDAIPHRKVGRHRRVRLEDLIAYKSRIDRKRERILDQLTREAQEQGLGYNRK